MRFKEKNGGGFDLPFLTPVPPPYISLKFTTAGRKRILSQSFLHEKYIKEELKIEQIATLANSSSRAVKKRLNKFGLEDLLRKRHIQASQKARSQAEIKRLRDSGLSMRATALEMVKLGYPNLASKVSWQPMMVQRLLKEFSA